VNRSPGPTADTPRPTGARTHADRTHEDGAEGIAVAADERVEVSLVVNGVTRVAAVPARRLLSDVLRHDLELTGTHVGCEHGVCGACTVLLDGEPVRSCLTFAISVRDHEITTVEGLAADDGTLHPVQQGFQDHHGLQCGYCTPGFVMSACGFLADQPEPDDETIRDGMSGNLCRCTGYAGILAAVKQAAGVLRTSGADPRARYDATRDGPNAPEPDGEVGARTDDAATGETTP
jgi:aerobic carbon-monoxide dehydrogenase small subunit